jgi:hypothetical protein
MTNDESMTKLEWQKLARRPLRLFGFRHLDFLRHSAFVLRHSFERGTCTGSELNP